jgi:hypothetical protein
LFQVTDHSLRLPPLEHFGLVDRAILPKPECEKRNWVLNWFIFVRFQTPRHRTQPDP